MYNTYINEEDQQVFERYSKQQEQIQNDFSTFITQTRTAQKVITKTLTDAFLASAKTTAEQYKHKTNSIMMKQCISLRP